MDKIYEQADEICQSQVESQFKGCFDIMDMKVSVKDCKQVKLDYDKCFKETFDKLKKENSQKN